MTVKIVEDRPSDLARRKASPLPARHRRRTHPLAGQLERGARKHGAQPLPVQPCAAEPQPARRPCAARATADVAAGCVCSAARVNIIALVQCIAVPSAVRSEEEEEEHVRTRRYYTACCGGRAARCPERNISWRLGRPVVVVCSVRPSRRRVCCFSSSGRTAPNSAGRGQRENIARNFFQVRPRESKFKIVLNLFW